MRIDGVDSDYFFKALFKEPNGVWKLTQGYFKSREEVKEFFDKVGSGLTDFAWPVEVDPIGFCSCPDEKETA